MKIALCGYKINLNIFVIILHQILKINVLSGGLVISDAQRPISRVFRGLSSRWFCICKKHRVFFTIKLEL